MSGFKTKDMVWAQCGNDFYHRPKSDNVDELSPGVYRLCIDEHGCLYLNKFKDKYDLPEKVYNTDKEFIERVLKTFTTVKKNLGVLLTGVKGSGKTVTSKQICNQSGLPVIVVDKEYDRMPGFIGNIKQPLVIFVDEYVSLNDFLFFAFANCIQRYEKVYEDESASLLPLMDGASSSTESGQRLFLLTANNSHINCNMMQRPGRVRYIKQYEDLDQDTILELLDDRLKHPHHRAALLDFISRLKIISIDIVMSLIEEVNIHDESPEDFEDVFNVKRLNDNYDLFDITDIKEPKLLKTGVSCEVDYSDIYIGHSFSPANRNFGQIIDVIDNRTVVVRPRNKDGSDSSKNPHKTYQLRSVDAYHPSFTAPI